MIGIGVGCEVSECAKLTGRGRSYKYCGRTQNLNRACGNTQVEKLNEILCFLTLNFLNYG